MQKDNSRGRILFLVPELPVPSRGGASARSYWLLQALCREFQVDVVAAAQPPAQSMPSNFLRDLNSKANSIFVANKTPLHPNAISRLQRLQRTLSTRSYFLAGCKITTGLKSHVHRLLQENQYSAVHIESILMAQASSLSDIGVPIVYDAHNAECELLRRRAESERWPHNAVLKWDWTAVAILEKTLLARSAMVFCTSAEDAGDLEAIEPSVGARSVIVPNGADCRGNSDSAASMPIPGRVLVTGSFDWRPNYAGLKWLLEKVLPSIGGAGLPPDFKLCIAGRMSAQVKKELEALPDVEVIANPENMQPHLSQAQVIAVPVLASSGTRLRILEGWSAGRPIVTTSAGIFGLPGANRTNAIIADEPQDFGNGVVELLTDKELWLKMHKAGLDLARSRFDWTLIGETMLEAYRTRLNV